MEQEAIKGLVRGLNVKLMELGLSDLVIDHNIDNPSFGGGRSAIRLSKKDNSDGLIIFWLDETSDDLIEAKCDSFLLGIQFARKLETDNVS